jgi:hypothetical protein
MTFYVCTEVVDSVCQAWAQQFGFLPALTAEQGATVGGSILLCMATAWGFRFLVRFLLNR